MDNEKHKAYLQQAEAIKSLPEIDQPYYVSRLMRDYLNNMDAETISFILAIADVYWTDEAKQLIHEAVCDNALWPERVVQQP